MSRKGLILILIFSVLIGISQGSDFKKNVKITKLAGLSPENYMSAPKLSTSFAAAEFCSVQNYDSIAWAVTHWVIGDELYKAYQDPSMSCDNPYPFAIEKIFYVLSIDKPCSLPISVDVDAADLTEPSCPVPGALLDISSTYMVTISTPGLYQLDHLPIPGKQC